MSLDLLLLFAILLDRAQRGSAARPVVTTAPPIGPAPGPALPPATRPVTSAPTPGGGRVTTLPEILITASPPAQAAAASQAKANEAAQQAREAAQRGDTVTASTKAQEATAHQQQANSAAKGASAPPAWPQVVPGGLPPFPGPGWHPASPVTSAMGARAWQLLAQLWAHGAGTWKTEKTGDRWVTYRATDMGGGKKGVVAYTTTSQAPGATAPTAQASMNRPASPAAAPTVPASSAAMSMPVLKLTSPRTQSPSVVWLQQRLGLANPDGVYGTGTQAAVVNFQRAHGLEPDGVVGKNTWTALGVGQSAAA